jgi:putative transposase
MARAVRLQFEDAIYHLTARGNRRKRIFAGAGDRRDFLEIIARSLPRFGVELNLREISVLFDGMDYAAVA